MRERVLTGELGRPSTWRARSASPWAGPAGRPRPPRRSGRAPSCGHRGVAVCCGNLYLRALTLHAAVYNLAAQVFTDQPDVVGGSRTPGFSGRLRTRPVRRRSRCRPRHPDRAPPRRPFGFRTRVRSIAAVVLLRSTHCDRPAVVRDCTGGRNRRCAARLRRRARQRQCLLPHAAADRHPRRPTSPHRWRLPPDHVRIHPYRQRPGRCSRGDGRHPGAAACGTIGLALSAIPMLARRIRQLPNAAAATTVPTRSSWPSRMIGSEDRLLAARRAT